MRKVVSKIGGFVDMGVWSRQFHSICRQCWWSGREQREECSSQGITFHVQNRLWPSLRTIGWSSQKKNCTKNPQILAFVFRPRVRRSGGRDHGIRNHGSLKTLSETCLFDTYMVSITYMIFSEQLLTGESCLNETFETTFDPVSRPKRCKILYVDI